MVDTIIRQNSNNCCYVALKSIFKEIKPDKIWVDKGKELYNKKVKNLIDLYSTENEEKSSVV